jgi:hypothetical protein
MNNKKNLKKETTPPVPTIMFLRSALEMVTNVLGGKTDTIIPC